MLGKRRLVMKQIAMTILSMCKRNIPLDQLAEERELQARNGLHDLDSKTGILSASCANYTSRTFINELLDCMASTEREAYIGDGIQNGEEPWTDRG